MNGPEPAATSEVPDAGGVLDARIARLVGLLADRDQQLADRLVVTDLAARLDRAEAALTELQARAVAAESEALAATERAQRAEQELVALRAHAEGLSGTRLATMGAKRTARQVSEHLSQRWSRRA